MKIKMENISLKQFLNELIQCIYDKKDFTDYYLYIDKEFKLITSVDLYNRIQTEDDDFTEFDWEKDKSIIYKKIIVEE